MKRHAPLEYPMRILFDYQAFHNQKQGGVSRYIVELARRLAEQPGVEVVIFAGLHRNQLLGHMKPCPGLRIIGQRLPDCMPFARVFGMINRLAFAVTAKRIRPDIYHATYYKCLARGVSAQRVLMVYDMIHELGLLPSGPADPTSARKKRAIAAADLVLCDSFSTQRDLVRLLGIDPGRTLVTQLGCEFPGAARPERPLPDPYLLFVGDRAHYKNAEALWTAWSGHANLHNRYHLVFFGGRAASGPERAKATDPAHRGRVHFTRGGDEDLATWYRHAFALVYPSRYEGFGIPPLEAMQFDCPVVASNRSSIPEVVGDAALLFNPEDAEALAGALQHLDRNPTARATLVKAGQRQWRRFDWATCAQKTVAAYRRLASRMEVD